MNTNILIRLKHYFLAIISIVLFFSCEREVDNLQLATYSTNPEVFIDGFSGGLNYAAFGGSVPTAFDVDKVETYNNSAASMRFDVPNEGNPAGSYAGGVFFTQVGRDLSQYNVLTFWAKASQAATLSEIGFGNDLGENKFATSINGLSVSTNWQKYYIPIPDASKLTCERGLFWYAVGNVDGEGFTFWIDEVKYENLGTVAHPKYSIFNGEERTQTSFTGVNTKIDGLTTSYNLPNGINQNVNAASAFFTFSSSDITIATVDEFGNVAVIGGPGTAKITAKVGDTEAEGILIVNSDGDFPHAPTPTHTPENVISIFSDTYTNIPVSYYNGYWAPYQTTLSADFDVNNDHLLHYYEFNFVGTELANPTDASVMTNFHLDIYLPNALTANAQFKIKLVNKIGTVTTEGAYTHTIPASQAQQWISLDIPFTSFAGLTNRTNLWQIIFEDVSGNISSFYADNIYFHK